MEIICRPGRRCNLWRECERCARIRQAQIADVAVNRLSRNSYLTYVVLTTREPVTLESDKARVLRVVRNLSSGGVWTVEAGEQFRGLHVNLMIASERPLAVSKIQKAWADLGEVHSEPVLGWREYWQEVRGCLKDERGEIYAGQLADIHQMWANEVNQIRDQKRKAAAAEKLDSIGRLYSRATDSARSVAAYSAKQSGFPARHEYSGRIYGSWGSAGGALRSGEAKHVSDVCATDLVKANPWVSGVSIIDDLERAGAIERQQINSGRELAAQLRELEIQGVAHDYAHVKGRGFVHLSELKKEQLQALKRRERREKLEREGLEMRRTVRAPGGEELPKQRPESKPEAEQEKTPEQWMSEIQAMLSG